MVRLLAELAPARHALAAAPQLTEAAYRLSARCGAVGGGGGRGWRHACRACAGLGGWAAGRLGGWALLIPSSSRWRHACAGGSSNPQQPTHPALPPRQRLQVPVPLQQEPQPGGGAPAGRARRRPAGAPRRAHLLEVSPAAGPVCSWRPLALWMRRHRPSACEAACIRPMRLSLATSARSPRPATPRRCPAAGCCRCAARCRSCCCS